MRLSKEKQIQLPHLKKVFLKFFNEILQQNH